MSLPCFRQVGLRLDFETFFQFVLTVMATSITFNAIGHFFSAALPDAQVAGIVGGLFIAVSNLFK